MKTLAQKVYCMYMENLYIFLDESGNFDFKSSGTKHFVVCAYSTVVPHYLVSEMYDLKYELLRDGYEQECFHATEDEQFIRNAMYKIISKGKGSYDYVYLEKAQINKEFQNKKDMYNLMVKVLIKKVLQRESESGNVYINAVVVLDKILNKSDKSYVRGLLRSELKKFNLNFSVYYFQTKSDCNAQIADYGSWAKYVSLEREEHRPLNEIQHLVREDIDILNTQI